jgi:hypothetical protein
MLPSVCRKVAPHLVRWMQRLHAGGMQVDPDVMAWVEAVRAEASSSIGTSEFRGSPTGAQLPHEFDIDVTEAARRLSCTERNVTALANRGTLAGRFAVGRWWFDPDDVDDYRRRRDERGAA